MMSKGTMQEPIELQRGQTVCKAPEAVMPVAFRWHGERHLKDHQIATSRWSVANCNFHNPITLHVEAAVIGRDRLSTQAVLKGGTSGMHFVLTNMVTTAGGARIDRAVIVAIPTEAAR